MSTIHPPASSQRSPIETQPYELTWGDVRELGIDPAPVGMTESDEQNAGVSAA